MGLCEVCLVECPLVRLHFHCRLAVPTLLVEVVIRAGCRKGTVGWDARARVLLGLLSRGDVL